MAKIKRISINALERVMKDGYEPTITIEWHGLEVTIKKVLSLTEVIKFVEDTVETCFAADTNDYIPEVKDFAIKANVLEMYANFTLPKNNDSKYALIYQTDAFPEVIKYINSDQFDEVCRSIDEKLRYRSSDLLTKFNDQIDDALKSIEEIGNNISNIFDGVDSETMSGIASAIANGEIDEQKLVEAYVKTTAGATGNEPPTMPNLIKFPKEE